MASVLDLLKPLAQPSMNGFDLSQKHVYGSAPGRFDAPLFIETMPHDKFQIDVAALMRTMTLNTSAFLRGKVTFDFYFVPYTQIWHPFNQFVDKRLDSHSVLQRGTKYVPVFNLYNMFKFIKAVYDRMKADGSLFMPYYLRDIHQVPWYSNIFNMLDFFGYGNFLHIKEFIESDDFTDVKFESMIENYKTRYCNIFRPAAYQHIWYDYIRNKYFDNYENEQAGFMSDYVMYFNFDDIRCDTFANSVIGIDYTDIDSPTNLRIIGLFTQRYVQYKQDLIQSVLPSQQFGAVSDVMVDVDSVIDVQGSATLSGSTGTDYERWTDYSGQLMAGDSPVASNTDGKSLRTNAAGAGGHRVIQHTHLVEGTATLRSSGTASGNGSFDVIALKRAEALQKWRQNVMRAGNMVDDNFRAHFGVTPRYESDNNALKLGSFEGTLNVNTVETTAISSESGNNKVGDLGATATSVIEGSTINFQCSDFGVIVCTQYFRPESEYSSVMIDRAVTLHEPFDFPMPEFCNLGLNPVVMSDYNFMERNPDEILGFNSQYWWYKQAVDKCHGEFAKFRYWQQNEVFDDIYLFKGDSVMWNAPRLLDMLYTLQGGVSRSKSSFYVNPNILNDVFGVDYYHIPTKMSEVSADLVNQLIFNVFFKVKAIRPLTSVGLPNF